jgi:photosystem II stability/assembly factor-like uncharacterized protein
MRKKILPIVLTLTLLLAGCNLPATGGGPAITLTPVPPIGPVATTDGSHASLGQTPVAPAATATVTITTMPTINPAWIVHLASGTAVDITRVQMLDSQLGWAVGGIKKSGVYDHVLRTKDGGISWMDVTPPELADGQGAAIGFFQDANSAWVTFHGAAPASVPANPVVWRTTDGGASWTASAPLNTTDLEVYSVSDVFFSGPAGWILVHAGAGMNHDYVAIYHSTDNGQTWARLVDPVSDGGIQSCSKTGLFFQDKTNGWLTGDCNGVAPGALLFRTGDAGQTWQPVALPPPADKTNLLTAMDFACGIRSPFAYGSTVFFAVECDDFSGATPKSVAYLYSTSDRGANWVVFPYPGGDYRTLDGGNGWALGLGIFKTSNGGRDWAKISTVTWEGQFNFISSTLGFAVAQKGGEYGLVQTTDGGVTWILLAPVVAPGA